MCSLQKWTFQTLLDYCSLHLICEVIYCYISQHHRLQKHLNFWIMLVRKGEMVNQMNRWILLQFRCQGEVLSSKSGSRVEPISMGSGGFPLAGDLQGVVWWATFWTCSREDCPALSRLDKMALKTPSNTVILCKYLRNVKGTQNTSRKLTEFIELWQVPRLSPAFAYGGVGLLPSGKHKNFEKKNFPIV